VSARLFIFGHGPQKSLKTCCRTSCELPLPVDGFGLPFAEMAKSPPVSKKLQS